MKISGSELREKNRLKLEEVVPLDTPLLMYLEPTNACNIRCKFCPTSDSKLLKEVGRPMGLMSWELFEKIVADLKLFPKELQRKKLKSVIRKQFQILFLIKTFLWDEQLI